jgi:hypothetical protein
MHSVALGVISNARGRQRRRHVGTAAALPACAGAATGFIAGRTSPASLPPQTGGATRVAPAAVFAQAPSMGWLA